MFLIPKCLAEDYERFVLKFPFSKEARQRIADVDLSVLLEGDNLKIVLDQLESILGKGKVLQFDDVEKALVAHYGALLVVSQLPRRTWVRFADVESKYMSENLALEVDRECVMYVAREFGINVKKIREALPDICERLLIFYDVAVPVWDYLKFMPRNDPNWKLINRCLVRGFVLLTYGDLVRLVEEAVERHILKALESLSENTFVQDIVREKLGDELEKLKRKYGGVVTSSLSAGDKHARDVKRFPPCIEAILNEIRSGGNPSHMARFTLAAFMLHVLTEYEGKTIEEAVEEVVNLFRTVADFDEKKTRYQVMHIAGLVGGRKFYMPPNCDELISLGLCPVNGACKVKNPLVAYAKMMRSARRQRGSERSSSERSTPQSQAVVQGK